MKLRLLVLFLLPHLVFASGGAADTIIQGIRIKFNYEDHIYPESWRVFPINGEGESLDRIEQNRSIEVVRRAFAKYPRETLRQNLKTVCILKSMNFYGVGYGGTNSDEVVYITNNSAVMGYSDYYIEQTFHHEFSSILYRNYPLLFDSSGWAKTNPPGFDYKDPENGVGAIRNNESSQELDTSFCSLGFLTQYALSGLENDINTLAQNLFLPSDGFWKIVDSYPAIAKKTRILISFYHAIHPKFTEDFFRRQ